MKRYSSEVHLTEKMIPFGLCMMLVTAAVIAHETTTRYRDRMQRGRPATAIRQDRGHAIWLDENTTGANVRASQLIGMNIQNPQGESVGEVNDLVLDANSGRVRYAAVTYGGFLGVGNNMFAVPFDAFLCRHNPDDQHEYVLVLDVTQEQLEGAQGFDEDHWPNFADRNFTRDLDRRYGVNRRMRNREVEVDIARDAIDIEIEAKESRDRD